MTTSLRALGVGFFPATGRTLVIRASSRTPDRSAGSRTELALHSSFHARPSALPGPSFSLPFDSPIRAVRGSDRAIRGVIARPATQFRGILALLGETCKFSLRSTRNLIVARPTTHSERNPCSTRENTYSRSRSLCKGIHSVETAFT
jgi:hypothetical protein